MEAGMPSEAQSPITLRLCLAGLVRGRGAAPGKGRQAASGQGMVGLDEGSQA